MPFCCPLALSYRREGSAETSGELELQKESTTLLSSCFIVEAFKALGCLKDPVYLKEKDLCYHPAHWHLVGHCLLSVLGLILSCVHYAESLGTSIRTASFS